MASVPSGENFPLTRMAVDRARFAAATHGETLQIIEAHERDDDGASNVVILIGGYSGDGDMLFTLSAADAIEIAQEIVAAACAVGTPAEVGAAILKLQGTVFVCRAK